MRKNYPHFFESMPFKFKVSAVVKLSAPPNKNVTKGFLHSSAKTAYKHFIIQAATMRGELGQLEHIIHLNPMMTIVRSRRPLNCLLERC